MGASTIVLILFWILVQTVPLLVVWLTYKVTPNQNVSVSGPLSNLNIKVVGALGAWIITVTLMTNYSDNVFSFIADNGESKLKHWTIEGELLLLDINGKPIPNMVKLNKEQLKITLSPGVYGVENGTFSLEVIGEDMPEIESFHIAYTDQDGTPIAEAFVNMETLVDDGARLLELQNLISQKVDKRILKIPYPIRLRQKDPSQMQQAFSKPYVPPAEDGGVP